MIRKDGDARLMGSPLSHDIDRLHDTPPAEAVLFPDLRRREYGARFMELDADGPGRIEWRRGDAALEVRRDLGQTATRGRKAAPQDAAVALIVRYWPGEALRAEGHHQRTPGRQGEQHCDAEGAVSARSRSKRFHGTDHHDRDGYKGEAQARPGRRAHEIVQGSEAVSRHRHEAARHVGRRPALQRAVSRSREDEEIPQPDQHPDLEIAVDRRLPEAGGFGIGPEARELAEVWAVVDVLARREERAECERRVGQDDACEADDQGQPGPAERALAHRLQQQHIAPRRQRVDEGLHAPQRGNSEKPHAEPARPDRRAHGHQDQDHEARQEVAQTRSRGQSAKVVESGMKRDGHQHRRHHERQGRQSPARHRMQNEDHRDQRRDLRQAHHQGGRSEGRPEQPERQLDDEPRQQAVDRVDIDHRNATMASMHGRSDMDHVVRQVDIESHCCPVKKRTDSIGCRWRRHRSWDDWLKRLVARASSRKA